jgi:hypothetical protein
MADLMDKLGKKKEEEITKVKELASETTDLTAKAAKMGKPAAADLIASAAGSGDDADVKADEASASEDETASTESEDEVLKDFADWTPKQFAKALKEARNEAAERRVQAKDLEQRVRTEYDSRLKQIEEKFAPLVKKAEQLDKLKNEEADKKRSLEEKLSHREQVIAEREKEMASLRDEMQTEKQSLQDELHKAKTALEAHETFYKEQLGRELAEVPKKFSKLAESMGKGASNTQEALDLIREAKRENLFGNKKVTVFNGTPGAETGARLDSRKAQEAAKAGMKSSDKIRAGIKGLVTSVKDTRNKFGI